MLDDCLELAEVLNLVAPTARKAQRVIKKEFESLVSVLEDLGGLEVPLCHICFSNVCCLVIGHQVKVEHQFVHLAVLPLLLSALGAGLLRRAVSLVWRDDGFPKSLGPLGA